MVGIVLVSHSQELARGLMERRPSRMFEVLAECGAAAVVRQSKTTAKAGNIGAMLADECSIRAPRRSQTFE